MATEKYRDKARSKRCSLTARIETQGMRKATARRSWQRAEDTQSKNGSKPSGPQGCDPACRRPPCRSLNKQYGSGAAERMKNRSLFQKEQTREQHSVQRGTLTLFEMPGKSLLACPSTSLYQLTTLLLAFHGRITHRDLVSAHAHQEETRSLPGSQRRVCYASYACHRQSRSCKISLHRRPGGARKRRISGQNRGALQRYFHHQNGQEVCRTGLHSLQARRALVD